MDEKIEKRLSDFMTSRKPDSNSYLNNFSEEIIILSQNGYSYKLIHEYLTDHGVGCAYSTFIKWAKTNITPLLSNTKPAIQRTELNTTSETNSKPESASSGVISGSVNITTNDVNAAEPITVKKQLIEENTGDTKIALNPKEALAKKLADSKARLDATLGKSPKQLISEANKP